MAVEAAAPYPVRFDVDYPEQLDRLTTLLRLIWVLPIAILLYAVGNTTTFAPFLLILFRRKYPRWMFDWNLELTRFSTRVTCYGLLLRDEYPASDEEQAVHLEIDYPDVERDLNRWLPLVKWLLAIPHLIVLIVLFVVALVLVVVAWFAILFTGRYPRGIFNFVVGTLRWGLRVEGYAILLVTDRYPPFSLD
jgi:hypothetical protein